MMRRYHAAPSDTQIVRLARGRRDTASAQCLGELIWHPHPPLVVFELGATDTQVHDLARIGEPEDPDLALVEDFEEAVLGLTAYGPNADPTVTVVGHLDVCRPFVRIVDRDLIHVGGQPQTRRRHEQPRDRKRNGHGKANEIGPPNRPRSLHRHRTSHDIAVAAAPPSLQPPRRASSALLRRYSTARR